jgi:dihydrofolate reductase
VRRIIASEGITLDGYFADPQGGIAWQALDEEFNAYSIELLDSVDTLLFGRVTYEQMTAWWPTSAGEGYSPEIARRMNAVAKLVVSSNEVGLSWNNARQLKEDLPKAVTQLKGEAGKDIAILGSGSVVAQLTDHGLIDEYRLTLNPVILGAGTGLFKDVRNQRKLKLVGTREFATGTMLLRYQPAPTP